MSLPDSRAVILKTFGAAVREYVKRGEFKTEGAMNRHLWSAALAFFRDEIDAFVFLDIFIEEIRNQLTRAWNEGARSVDVTPDEMTEGDRLHLDALINSEYNHIIGLAEAIENAKLYGWTLDQFRSAFRARIDLWSNRYRDVVNEARIWFGGKARLMWRLGATEEHCSTCNMLNGLVAWAEEWDQSQIRPQSPPNPILECGGWKCKCALEPTEQRRGPQAFARLLNIAVLRAGGL